ncbi:MAG: hypothetical protein AAGM22_03595, partial [Acidobacteriota bacterium]
QIERDRIIHTPISRKLTEKYQVLYDGQRKVVRNYSTHVNRLVQVTRAICRWLDLNADFAESIALGSKVGSLPFIHASKPAVESWTRKKLLELDNEYVDRDPEAKPKELKQMELDFEGATLPHWLHALRSPRMLRRVQQYIPWAAGHKVDKSFCTGQQAYWMLAVNPFCLSSRRNNFSRETMYGIWRHSLGSTVGPRTFRHRIELPKSPGRLEVSFENATYESVVVSYADDITWVIENLNDANTAALLNGRRSRFNALLAELGQDAPSALQAGLTHSNTGSIYHYFINDFNENSERVLQGIAKGYVGRAGLREGDQKALIGLSEEGQRQLEKMKNFLREAVFGELRIRSRNEMLKTVSEACLKVLYQGKDDLLPNYINDKANVEGWAEEPRQEALRLLKDDVHRVQLTVSIFCEMGDHEIYDLVGIESL